MAFDRQKYLQPSELCDFNLSPRLEQKAKSLILGCRNRKEKFLKIFGYVKELHYGLEDWDLKASDILKKGWGMCSGKTNLLVALLRAVGIPARYRIYKIVADVELMDKLGQSGKHAAKMKKLGEFRDHVDCQVWIDKWLDCDPGRDSAMERGLVKLGRTVERQKVVDASGKVRYTKLASFDDWAKSRQRRRTFQNDRKEVFMEANKGFERLRRLGA
jgi:transglutaminase-like putative cysteine protease